MLRVDSGFLFGFPIDHPRRNNIWLGLLELVPFVLCNLPGTKRNSVARIFWGAPIPTKGLPSAMKCAKEPASPGKQ